METLLGRTLTLLLILLTACPARAGVTVLYAEGDASVRSNGATHPAARNDVLSLQDELVVPQGGLAVLQLPNGYAVRIDDDLTIRVSDLALLKSPPTHEALESQLGRLLSNDERQRYGRLMGAHASLEAADSIEPQAEPASKKKSGGARSAAPAAAQAAPVAQQAEAMHRALMDSAAPASAAPPPPAAPPPASPQPAAPGGLSGLSGHGVGGGLSKDAEVTERWWLLNPTDAQPRLQPGAPPPAAVELVHRPALRTCVESAARAAALPAGHLPRVMLQVRGGRLLKLRLEGGLPLDPTCPQPGDASVGSLPDGWLLLEVPR